MLQQNAAAVWQDLNDQDKQQSLSSTYLAEHLYNVSLAVADACS